MASNKTATIIFKGDDQISPAIKGATASVAGLSKSLNEVGQAGVSAGTDIKKAVSLDSLQLNAISQSFGAIAGKLTELKTAAVGAFGEIAAAERKLSTVSNQSKELIKNFGDLAAANKFQTTTAELATASYEVLSAGFTDAADVTKILEASTKGGVGGFSDVSTVSKATISALNAYGASADQAGAFVDKFVSVQQSGLITVDQYASQIARIAPTAAAAGLSLDELNGAIATATAAGVPVESTFSGLRTAIGAILKPSSEASELAQELGINFNAAGLKTLGLSGILKQLKTTGNDSADTLLKLFGSAEALAAIAPSINAIEKLEANIKASSESAGLASTNFEKAVDPIKALANETTEALAILGRDILKVFNPVLQGTKAVVAAFRELPEPLQQVIAFVVGGGAAIATTGAAISGFLAVLSPTLAGLLALGTGVTTAISFLTAGQIALGTATATTTGLTAAEAAAFGGVAAASGAATTGVGGLTTATTGLGVAAGITAGTLGLIALAAAPLVVVGKQLTDAFNTAEVVKGLDDIENKIKDLRAKRGKAEKEELQDDGLGSSGFVNPFNTRLSEQQAVIQFGTAESQAKLNKIAQDGVAVLKEYGLASDESGKKIKLSKEQLEKFTEKVKESKEELDLAIDGLQRQGEQAKGNPVLQRQIRAEIIFLSNRKKLLDERVKQQTETAKKVEAVEQRSSEIIEEIAKKRIDKEKQATENAARLRGREFEKTANAETDTFEKQATEEKRTFQRSLNAEQKAFADAQKADKDQFEKGLLAEQKAFNDGEKAKDSQFQKQKQDAERAFNAQQQAQKAAFDKAQQQAARDFDTKQNADKLAAEGQFAKRRAEIERQLQLEAAATPEDKAKLEAEFKAADEKAAKEKAAFAQLKADEEAFAKKQQADKIAFDDAQKAKDAAFEKQQQAAKIAFEDAQKAKDIAFEAQKQAAKLAFEDQLKAKRDALEATQNAEKLAFEDQLNLKKQEFEDAERAKKAAFDDAQNEKKIAFEDAERAKKQAFEDNLKNLEKQFKKEERDKDIAAAKQVAAIKSGSTPVVAAKPLATGGSFRAGEQLLVGERGAELVKFGTSGTVTNAATTRQIMQSSNSSPNGANMARVEALLSQLVGKMDRPNIAVQTSENPSDVVVKVQREIARAAAMGAGI